MSRLDVKLTARREQGREGKLDGGGYWLGSWTAVGGQKDRSEARKRRTCNGREERKHVISTDTVNHTDSNEIR